MYNTNNPSFLKEKFIYTGSWCLSELTSFNDLVTVLRSCDVSTVGDEILYKLYL